MRKSKEVKLEVERAIERLKECEVLAREAEKEENGRVDAAREQIMQICSKENLFCGMILSTEDIAGIVKLAIGSKEHVKIPFNLYFND